MYGGMNIVHGITPVIGIQPRFIMNAKIMNGAGIIGGIIVNTTLILTPITVLMISDKIQIGRML